MAADIEGISFHPPFDQRPEQELHAIIGDKENWQPLARAMAEAELRKRGASQAELDRSKREHAMHRASLKEAHRLEILRRPKESYTGREALVIFATWTPFVMLEHMAFGLLDLTGKGLWTLSAEKRWLKFWQRCGLILASITLYAFILTHFIIDQ